MDLRKIIIFSLTAAPATAGLADRDWETKRNLKQCGVGHVVRDQEEKVLLIVNHVKLT